MYREVSASISEIDDISTTYGNSGVVLITACYGERYQNINDKDALTISIQDTSRLAETGRYNYFFESHFFSDEDYFDAGKGYTYDGYSTWTGYRYDTDIFNKEWLTIDMQK